MAGQVPTLYEWAGGIEALNRLTGVFYGTVLKDPLLEPVFRNMSDDHPMHVAAFLGEVFGGPKTYTEKFGGHPSMIQHHLNRHLTEAQRRQWIALLLDAADQAGLPDDPEFRSAFVAYIEWGTRAGAAELAGRRQAGTQRADAAVGMGRARRPLCAAVG
jgi:hemoglobin